MLRRRRSRQRFERFCRFFLSPFFLLPPQFRNQNVQNLKICLLPTVILIDLLDRNLRDVIRPPVVGPFLNRGPFHGYLHPLEPRVHLHLVQTQTPCTFATCPDSNPVYICNLSRTSYWYGTFVVSMRTKDTTHVLRRTSDPTNSQRISTPLVLYVQ